MPASSSALRTYVAESAKNARLSVAVLGPRRATNRPASGKPTMSASVSAVHVALLAAITSSSRTIRGRSAVLAGRKKRLAVVIAKTSG